LALVISARSAADLRQRSRLRPESLPALRSPGSCRGFAARASGPGLRRQARRVGRGSARGGWQVNSPFGRLYDLLHPRLAPVGYPGDWPWGAAGSCPIGRGTGTT